MKNTTWKGGRNAIIVTLVLFLASLGVMMIGAGLRNRILFNIGNIAFMLSSLLFSVVFLFYASLKFCTKRERTKILIASFIFIMPILVSTALLITTSRNDPNAFNWGMSLFSILYAPLSFKALERMTNSSLTYVRMIEQMKLTATLTLERCLLIKHEDELFTRQTSVLYVENHNAFMVDKLFFYAIDGNGVKRRVGAELDHLGKETACAIRIPEGTEYFYLIVRNTSLDTFCRRCIWNDGRPSFDEIRPLEEDEQKAFPGLWSSSPRFPDLVDANDLDDKKSKRKKK